MNNQYIFLNISRKTALKLITFHSIDNSINSNNLIIISIIRLTKNLKNVTAIIYSAAGQSRPIGSMGRVHLPT